MPVGLPCQYRSSRATANTPRHLGQRIGRRAPCNGARCLQLGHTAYHSPQLAGNWTAFVGRGTMVQRRGSVSTTSIIDRGTVTVRRLTSRTTSSGESLLIRYHAPRRRGYGPSVLRRAHRKSIMGGPGLSCRTAGLPAMLHRPDTVARPQRERLLHPRQREPADGPASGARALQLGQTAAADRIFRTPTRRRHHGIPTPRYHGPRTKGKDLRRATTRATSFLARAAATVIGDTPNSLRCGPARCRPSVVDPLIGGGPEIQTHARRRGSIYLSTEGVARSTRAAPQTRRGRRLLGDPSAHGEARTPTGFRPAHCECAASASSVTPAPTSGNRAPLGCCDATRQRAMPLAASKLCRGSVGAVTETSSCGTEKRGSPTGRRPGRSPRMGCYATFEQDTMANTEAPAGVRVRLT